MYLNFEKIGAITIHSTGVREEKHFSMKFLISQIMMIIILSWLISVVIF